MYQNKAFSVVKPALSLTKFLMKHVNLKNLIHPREIAYKSIFVENLEDFYEEKLRLI